MSVRAFGFTCLLLVLPLGVAAEGQTEKPASAADEKQGEKPPPPAPKNFDLDLPLREGDVKVTGRVAGAIKSVIVRVYSGWAPENQRALIQESRTPDTRRYALTQKAEQSKDDDEIQAIRCVLSEPVSTAGPVPVTNSAFEVLLEQRLNGGDCVVVEDAAPPGGEEPTRKSEIARSVVLDLGRLRGYFAIGAAISQNRSSFSQVDTFVSFTNDSRLGGMVVVKDYCVLEESEATKADCRKRENRRPLSGPLTLRNFRWQVNAFTDARVGFRLATTGTETGKSVATGGQPAQPAFQRPDQLVFGSDQPGYFQAGLHMPFSAKAMDWRNDGKLYSFYVAPLYKWGVQSFDSPVVVKRVVEIDTTKPASDTARFSTKSEQLKRGALPFWGGGVRMGIYQYELLGRELRQRQIGNDPVAYFDVTWGKASGFRSYEFTRELDEVEKIETVTIDSRVRTRLALEARMKIPYLPALVGIDVNVRGATSDEEPNEFRFILAFRIDAQKALGRIFRSDALTQDR